MCKDSNCQLKDVCVQTDVMEVADIIINMPSIYVCFLHLNAQGGERLLGTLQVSKTIMQSRRVFILTLQVI